MNKIFLYVTNLGAESKTILHFQVDVAYISEFLISHLYVFIKVIIGYMNGINY